MKSWKQIFFCCIAFAAPGFIFSQTCADALKTIVHQNMAIGSGNAIRTFSVPKFDPELGTLMSVTLESEITLLYNFQLENQELVPINNYRVRVYRDDEISSLALMNPITNSYQRTYGPYALLGADLLFHSGADYISQGPLYVMNRSRVIQTVYNTADFLGAGTIDFDYNTSTYSSILGSVNYTFNATASDTVRLWLTYTYCSSFFLKADITSFTATKKESIVDLQWITQNEENDRKYEIQKSNDGRNFITVDKTSSLPGANGIGKYRYQYRLSAGEKGKLLFRLKEIEKNGGEKYSSIRIIDLGKQQPQPFRLYPNPASGAANLVFSNTKRDDWQVNIFTVNGQLLQQLHFNNALTARLNANQQLPKGIYFLKIINKKTEESFTQRLVIQ